MRETLRAFLEADGTLSGLLTGGIHSVEEISRQTAASAFDAQTKELLPCANIRLETETPFGPHDSSSQVFILISFYERLGKATIDQARERVFALLHRQGLSGETSIVEIQWTDDITDVWDIGLDSSLALSRYRAIRSNR